VKIKRSFSILIALGVLIITVCNLSGSPQRLDPDLADSLAQAIEDPLVQAKYYTEAWLNEKAIAVLEGSDDMNAETLWRLARARIDKGENIKGKDALIHFERAMAETQQAADLEPSNALAQQTLAIACGRVALFKGVFKSIGLVKRVHKAGLAAVANSDSIPVALYVLGRTHKKLIEKSGLVRKILGLGWAKADSVEYYFDRALEVSGGNMIQCLVEYADFLLSKKKNNDKARQMLEAAMKLPLRDEQDGKSIKWGKKMLEEIKK